MSVRERLSAVEQYLAYVIGLGITLAIIAMLLAGLGSASSASTNGMLLVGLALVVIGTAAWLYLARPWTKFDDMTTPLYTGHEDHADEPGAESAAHPASALPPAEPETAAEALLGESTPASPPGEEAAQAADPVGEGPVAPAPAELEEEVAPAIVAPTTGSGKRDKLLAIHGLGPKSQQVLYDAGITTFQAIANATPDMLNDILEAAGLRLVQADTWPEQAARLIADDADRYGA